MSAAVHEEEQRRVFYQLRVFLKCLLASGENAQDTVFENSIHLDRFCLAVERVFLHGFKHDAGFFSSTRDYWDFITPLSHFQRHAVASIDNVRAMGNARTLRGKGRAWIRVSLIEKSLESYISALSRQRKLTEEFYESWALMRNEEQVDMVVALLASLSTVNFSLCLKDIDFDSLSSKLPPPEEVESKIQAQKILAHQLKEQQRIEEEKRKELEAQLAEKDQQLSSIDSARQEDKAALENLIQRAESAASVQVEGRI